MKGLLFTYLLTYGGAAVAVFEPFMGLLIYVCFAILSPESLWPWEVPPGNYSRIVAIALLIGWVIRGFGDWHFGRCKAVVMVLGGYWIWAALGTMRAPDRELASAFLESLTKIVLPVLVGITVIDSVAKLKQLAWVITLSQGYIAYEMNLSYLQGFNLIREIGFAAMDNNSVAIAMVTGAGMALFLGLGAKHWWQKGLAMGAAGLMIHAVLLSFSRGGMVSLVCLAGISLVLIRRQPKYLLVVAVIALATLSRAGPELVERFSTIFVSEADRDVSAQSRLTLWLGCLDSMSKRPVFGVGPDHFPLVVEEYGFPRGKEGHTLWLQLGAELGIPGLVCLLAFYTLPVVRLWPLAQDRTALPDPWLRDAARMVIASLTGFTIAAQFVSLERLEIPYYVALLGMGVLKVTSNQQVGSLGNESLDGHSG
jgi:probable O-glycosylation ligase (exosortase A-associated)